MGKDGDTIALQKYIKEDLTVSKITDQNNDMRGECGVDELLESQGDRAMEELLKSRTGANMLEIDDDEYLAEVLLSQNNGQKFQRNMNMPQ